LPIFAAKNLGVRDEIAVKRSGQFQRDFHRLVVFERPEFELGHPLASVRFEDQVICRL